MHESLGIYRQGLWEEQEHRQTKTYQDIRLPSVNYGKGPEEKRRHSQSKEGTSVSVNGSVRLVHNVVLDPRNQSGKNPQ